MEVTYLCLNCSRDGKCTYRFCPNYSVQKRLRIIRTSGLAFKVEKKKGGRPKNPELSPEEWQKKLAEKKERNREACKRYRAKLTDEQKEEKKRQKREYYRERYRKLHPESAEKKKLTDEEKLQRHREKARENYRKRMAQMSPEDKAEYMKKANERARASYRKVNGEPKPRKKMTEEEYKAKQREYMKRYAEKHAEELKQKRKENYQKRLARMSPEELKAFREKVARKTMDYYNRKKEEIKCAHGE